MEDGGGGSKAEGGGGGEREREITPMGFLHPTSASGQNPPLVYAFVVCPSTARISQGTSQVTPCQPTHYYPVSLCIDPLLTG
eukprot:4811901-Pyramimonas_sp.AAC.1